MKLDSGQENDKIHQYFEVRNGKLLVTLPGLNRLLLDPRCPDAKQSNMIEYMELIKRKLLNKSSKK